MRRLRQHVVAVHTERSTFTRYPEIRSPPVGCSSDVERVSLPFASVGMDTTDVDNDNVCNQVATSKG